MGIDTGQAHGAARLMYPELPEPLTPADLHRLFTPNHAERQWAPTIARTPSSQLALLVADDVGNTVWRVSATQSGP
jgi:hypothetical protein